MVSASNEKRKKLAIIDGKSIFYRGYYAMPNLATPDGRPTGGVFGFASIALEVIRKLQPDYVCVAWDKPKTNIRKRLEMYPEYKAGRKPAPPDFYEQIPMLHELLEAFGWPLYELDDYEADDIMGALAVQATSANLDTALVTSDLDLLQTVNDSVHVYALKKGFSSIDLYHPDSLKEKYGIDVSQFLDMKALKGDSSDNIPGVPGIGEKGAVQLLQEYKTLDNIYDNLDLIKNSLRKKLEAGKESAYLSKKIASIWTDAPIKLDLKSLDVANCKPADVKHQLEKLQFKSLLRQLPNVMQVAESDARQSIQDNGLKAVELERFDTKSDKQLNELKGAVCYIATEYGDKSNKELTEVAVKPSESKVGLSLSLKDLSNKKIQKYLSSVKIVGPDIKSVLKLIGLDGPRVNPNNLFDIQIASFLLDPTARSQDIAGLARQHLDLEIGFSDDERRLGLELGVVSKLYGHLKAELNKTENKKLLDLFESVDMPIIPVLARMELAGIKLDVEFMEILSVEIDDKISDLKQEIFGFADQEFNISSPSQLATVLFEDMGLSNKGIKKGKTGFSTAASELEKLKALHPIIDLISQYREVAKLKSTYVDTLPKLVDSKSRIHTTFNLMIAQTGRLSSTDPNLQNIPVRTELGKRVRSAFVAEKGKTFVSADYSQFELRLGAYLAGDKDLIEQFNQDIDVHLATAALVYDRQPEDITKNMRRDAKVVNFGIMYGLGPHGLTATTGMTYPQAKDFIAKFFEVRPKLKDYIEKVKMQADEKGFVEDIFGRRRPTPDVKSSNFMVRESGYRAAVNMPFQGSAADIMKKAMIAIDQKLDDDCKMLLQIHDSVMIECPDEKAEKVAELLKSTMEEVVDLPIKLTVDTVTGKSWGQL